MYVSDDHVGTGYWVVPGVMVGVWADEEILRNVGELVRVGK